MKTQSDQLNELAPALAKAQAELPDVATTETAKVTGKNGSTFTYAYCTLADVRKTVGPILAKHGFAVSQPFIPRREGLCTERWSVLGSVRTLLLHSSGQWIAGEQPIAGDWGDPQRIGSAITYARRYGLAAICGIAQVDDDGQAAAAPAARATSNGHAPSRPNYAPRSEGPPLEDLEEPESEPDPGSSAYYRKYPEELQKSQGPHDFARQENAARFAAPDSGPPSRSSGGQVALPDNPPRTGKFLFGWVKDHQQFAYFNYLIERYPTQLSHQIKEWTNTQVKWGWEQYVVWLRSGEPLPTVNAAAGNGRH